MLTLPNDIIAILAHFAPLFSTPVFRHVEVLFTGAILAPGVRTVTSVLRVMGLQDLITFGKYHRVLSQDKWSARAGARILLGLLVGVFAPAGTLVMGIDETLERRRGKKIAARGIYHDPVRSSKSTKVRSGGLRWISMMLLAPIAWAGRIWALPFLTVLTPPERYAKERNIRYKTLWRWAAQMLTLVHRWLPDRDIVIVADNNYSVLALLDHCKRLSRRGGKVTMISRLRLDAGLYGPAPEPVPGKKGRRANKGARLPLLSQVLVDPATCWQEIRLKKWYGRKERRIEIVTDTAIWYHSERGLVPIRYVLIRDPERIFDSFALVCTDTAATAEQIVSWFVQRWQLESTFQEVREHLGVETQRQWSDLAIARTTPVLLGLFSMVTLLADEKAKEHCLPVRQASWYVKEQATFVDALAFVRRDLWHHWLYRPRGDKADGLQINRSLQQRITNTLCYAG